LLSGIVSLPYSYVNIYLARRRDTMLESSPFSEKQCDTFSKLTSIGLNSLHKDSERTLEGRQVPGAYFPRPFLYLALSACRSRKPRPWFSNGTNVHRAPILEVSLRQLSNHCPSNDLKRPKCILLNLLVSGSLIFLTYLLR
jgi:hypothetical protein